MYNNTLRVNTPLLRRIEYNFFDRLESASKGIKEDHNNLIEIMEREEKKIKEEEERKRRERETLLQKTEKEKKTKIREEYKKMREKRKQRRERKVAMKILLSMNEERTKELKPLFLQFKHGKLSRYDFVGIMKDFLLKTLEKESAKSEDNSSTVSSLSLNEYFSENGSDEKNLVLNLCELFNEIDFAGDKYITWEDFMSYLLESVSEQTTKDDEIKEYGLCRTIETSEIDDAVKKICYFSEWDKIVTCGKTKRCRIYNSSDFSTVATLPDHEGAILNAEYIPEPYNFLVTSSADLCVNFWGTERSDFDWKHTEQMEATQTVIKYFKRHNTLFSASRTGKLTYWERGLLSERRRKNVDKSYSVVGKDQNKGEDIELFFQKKEISLHSDVITDMIVLPNDNRIVTSSLDSSIKIFDVVKETKVKEFIGHSKGVSSIAWTNEYHFLISAGSEREPLVWIANVEGGSPFRLRDQRNPHQHSLVGVWAVPNSAQIISADHRGIVKIWDIRTHKCAQTISTELNFLKSDNQKKLDTNKFYLNSFTYIPNRKQIVTASRNIKVYEYERTDNPKGADDIPVISSLYNPKNYHFVTCSAQSVKLWDGLSGAVFKAYKNLSTYSDISTVCLDDRGRKIIIGNHIGEVLIFNFANGNFIKKFKIVDTEITSLVYCDDGSKCIIATSWNCNNNVLVLFDRGTTTEYRELKGHQAEVTCSAFSKTHILAITGDVHSNCIIWDIKSLSKVADIKGSGGTFTCICLLGVLPAFVIAEDNGKMTLFTTKPYFDPFIILNQWHNEPMKAKIKKKPQKATTSDKGVFITDNSKTGTFEDEEEDDDEDDLIMDLNPYPTVTAMDFDYISNQLITGDEKGNVCVYDLTSIIDASHLRTSQKYVHSRYGINSKEINALAPELLVQWKAHDNAVTHIQIIKEPSCIMTSSLDSKVTIWTRNGDLLDSLRQETKEWNDEEFERIMNDYSIADPKSFNFPINFEKRRIDDVMTVSGVINKIKKQLRIINLWKATSKEGKEERALSEGEKKQRDHKFLRAVSANHFLITTKENPQTRPSPIDLTLSPTHSEEDNSSPISRNSKGLSPNYFNSPTHSVASSRKSYSYSSDTYEAKDRLTLTPSLKKTRATPISEKRKIILPLISLKTNNMK
ncbi:hypothetical protein ABK040_005916 [Willaertia magna]